MNRFSILMASFALLAMPGFAQEQTATQPPLHVTTDRIQVLGSGPSESNMMFMLQDGAGKAAEGQIAFFTAEVALNHELIKNAPYTATAVTESTQTLADGTHITNKSSAFLARDSQGRTRREEVFGKMGPLHVEGPKLVFISDPVANTEYILEPADQSARILKPETINLDKNEQGLGIKIERRMRQKEEGTVSTESPKDVKHEDLGTQVIEGVSCQGRREVVTIPAGAIGNDRPLQISSENWSSPDLHTLVLRKHSDPRFGETVYRLTEIKLGEPDSSLFQVPSDYKTIVKPQVFRRALKPESKLPKD